MNRVLEARLRHVRHYLQVAQQSRSNPTHLEQDLVNILRAADTCIELEDWQLLTSLTAAINDYLKQRELQEYIRLNKSLITNDLTQDAAERAERLEQLSKIEASQGNYTEAIALNAQSIQLYERDENHNVEAMLEALQRASRLSRITGSYDEAIEHVLKCISLTRRYGRSKDEADFLYELAVLYEKKADIDGARSACEASLSIAMSMGYIDKMIDVLALRSSLYIAQYNLQAALKTLEEAFGLASRIGDVTRVNSIGEQLAGLGKIMGKNIFISYNHQDRPFVERLANDLKVAGLPIWWDQWEIKFGDSIIQKVSDGIDRSAYLVAVLSPHSVQSNWVNREIGSALMQQLSVDRGIVTVPLLAADCEIPVLLREIKRVDFREDYSAGLKYLLDFFVKHAH